MDILSSAASVIAVIQLTGSLVKICGGYIQEVKDARDEIITLQRAIMGLQGILQDLKKLLQSHNNTLPTSSRLVINITDCLSDLRALEVKLDPGRGKTLMRRVGLRALKWPLKRTEMEGIVQDLERYKSSFNLSLQLDQTTLITGMIQDAEHVNQMMDLDKLPFAYGAEYNSYPDQHEDECLQGTRTELLEQIKDWAFSPREKCLFWLNGMAGTGKSTISRTVAKSLKETKHLGASFFFKRGEGDRGNATRLFPTLARQLVLRFPGLITGLRKALHDDPDIASKSLTEQFDKILLQPLLELDLFNEQPHISVIVIDALDECEHDQDIRNIIRLLPLLQKAHAIRLRVFLTSRPELPIRLGFSEITNDDYQDLTLHDISGKVTEHDIYLFLKDRFAKIRHDRDISRDWPSDNVIEELVTMSFPLFICAATVCRYIENSKWDPALRLTELLKDQAKYAAKMDKTYLPILTRLLDDQDNDESEQQQLLQEFREIVGVIILLAVPLSINALSLFLGLRPDIISNRLDLFQSVLSVPRNRELPIRILHLSFRDFLVRSKSRFLVDESKKHIDIAMRCLITMRGHLKKNICNLKSYGIQRAEIDNRSIRQHLPPELQYSCRYWVHHLVQSKDVAAAIEDVSLFLQEHFLHWMEAMSLLGVVSEVLGIIDQLQPVIRDYKIFKFLHDGRRFVLKNRQIADEAPLQLYNSGLVFAPRTAIVRREFEEELPSWICTFPRVDENWSAEMQTFEGHSDSIQSVAFSPGGRILASGSSDKAVRLWDTATGVLEQTLKGHSESVQSVAFSPSGRILASGSSDKTIRLWDTATGELQQTLDGHSESVQSVVFSPDGQYLASGSNDRTVRLWDTATGALQQTLYGHLDDVRSVAFSSDGQQLASGSNDRTVRLWDTATGALQQTLKGHLDSVHSVAFSPVRRLLASGSRDETLKLWDTDTGALRQSLDGHSDSIWYRDWVASVTFSHDGRLLASGSNDRLVRLWDTTTGTLQQVLEGHSHCVQSVAFSPDGGILVSGSKDKTVRLWDITTDAGQQTHEGHSDWVWSIVFSPDGRLLASGSSDKTVRLWDTATGALLQTLKGHSRCVQSVAFSPDGRILASSSNDKTVMFWDTATGARQQILEGHLGIVWSVVFSPDGRLLASGSSDKTVRLWNVAIGARQQTLDGHSDEVRCVTFSPGGRHLASGSDDRTVRLWDTATGALRQTLCGHSDNVRSVAFSADGRLLASSSDDKTVRLWDTATGALQQSLGVQGQVTNLEFIQDGSHLGTNLGCLKTQSMCDNTISYLPQGNAGVFILDRQWITLHRCKVLWLPPEYRPWCSAIRGTTLALGHESGRVSFIGFCDSGLQ